MMLLLGVAGGTLIACAGLGLAAPKLHRRLPPQSAVVLLTCGSLSLALAAGGALAAVGWALVARLTRIAAHGHWSADLVAADLPVPGWLGVPAAAAVAALLISALVRTVRVAVLLARAESVCRALSPRGGTRIVLTDHGLADAFTIGGFRGRVVASRHLLAALGVADRRAVIAHEWSHLRHRHHLYVLGAQIAASALPFLGAVPAAVRFAVERWADEDAAHALGDRRAAAGALARVALVRQRLRAERRPFAGPGDPLAPRDPLARPVAALGAADHAVSARVLALMAEAPAMRLGSTVLCAASVAIVVAAAVLSLHLVHEVIEQASMAYQFGVLLPM